MGAVGTLHVTELDFLLVSWILFIIWCTEAQIMKREMTTFVGWRLLDSRLIIK